MKILLDSCISRLAVKTLREAGLDITWSGEWQRDPGDAEILATAYREGRVVVTLDKDFGELAIVRELPHSGIIRLVNFRVIHQATVTLRVLEIHGKELQEGAIITAEPGRLRIRLTNR